jgi:hypothetical protein
VFPVGATFAPGEISFFPAPPTSLNGVDGRDKSPAMTVTLVFILGRFMRR